MIHEEDIVHALVQDLNLPIENVETIFETNLQCGLDVDEARERLSYQGPNIIKVKQKRSIELYKFVSNLFGIHNCQLWLGAILCFMVYLTDNYLIEHDLEIKPDNLYVGISLLAFVFALGLFSYYMDAKCDFYRETCRDFLPDFSVAIREGVPQEVDDTNLVVGDLILFRTGERIPADVKIVESSAVQINQEMLNDCQRHFYRLLYKDFTPNRFFQVGDLVLNNTFIDKGHGKAIVTRTQHSYLAKCKVKNYQKAKPEKKKKIVGPLTKELNHFLNHITLMAIIMGIIFAVWSLWNGFSLFRALMLFIALYIGIITQALFPTLNVAKAQISKELATKNCYIQNIEALETLGSISVICTNKTGVITENKMIISQMWIDGRLMHSYEFMSTYKGTHLKEPYDSFVRVCSLCSFGKFSLDTDRDISPFKRNAIGKPSEVALLRYMEAFNGESIEKYQQRHRKCLEMLYNHKSRCSFQMVHFRGQLLVCLKGEPETLIGKCSTLLTSSGLKAFTANEKDRQIALCNELGRKKYRTIAIAQAFLPCEFLEHTPFDMVRFNEALINNQLEIQFLGLIVIENPVRITVPEAIFKCRNAGIKVVMTTADHPHTALSIAKTVGIVLNQSSAASVINLDQMDKSKSLLHSVPSNLYTSTDLRNISDIRLSHILSSGSDLVFSRITPEDKLRIVECCRNLPRIVAVTGIGSADLPVYEKAYVKISLSQYGADISKANSDVILLDDNFASIVHGIEEGRVLFDNIKKSLCYTLSSKPVEICPYILAFVFSMPKMASSITILSIDLIADNFPPIALGYETAEKHVMLERPRYIRRERVVNLDTILISLFFYGVIQFACGIFSYFVVFAQMGFFPHSLFFIAPKWYSAAVNDYEDDYGQEWTYQQRSELEFTGHTMYFITAVLCRIAVLYSCRTRRDSILRQIFSNTMINFSLFFLIFACAFLSYYPIFQYMVQMYPIKLPWWLIACPFFILIIVLEELRKFIIRRYPRSSVAKVFYY